MKLEEKFSEMVCRLSKNGDDIIEELNATEAMILHMAVGVATESGELLDAAKKMVFYGKNLDIDNVTEELGDLEFYMEGLRQLVGLTREETLEDNMYKLDKLRYKNGFSNQAAIERADKRV